MLGVTFTLLSAITLPFLSSNHQSLDTLQTECFAISMIGYDYVINSRAGLPIERALNTVTVDTTSEIISNTYKYYLREVVTNAYQWQDSPHMYAVKVMHSCAFNQGKNQSASSS